ncbi:MAG: hypothetical protein ACRCXZ_00480, partial [Patescibacteria group bacterium]
MNTKSFFDSWVTIFKEKLKFLDLESNSKLEDSKNIAVFTANRIATTPKKDKIKFFLIGVLIFSLIFTTLVYVFKPISESSDLKISRENFVSLSENPTNKDMIFKLNIPTAVRWNTQYYFFDKKDSEGNYNV